MKLFNRNCGYIKQLSLFIFIILASCNMLFPQPCIQKLNEGWIFKEARLTNWYPATVPGVVQTDLIKNGIIEDPFYRLNERGVQWVDKEDWVYKKEFNVLPDLLKLKNIILDCKGLDTYADVYINDSLVIKANNMFREWKADIKNIINSGKNTIKVYFHSPAKIDIPKFDALPFHYATRLDQSENGGLLDKKISIFARKAGYQYGWDWGPRLVTLGIWRPIEIMGWDNVAIDNVYIKQPNVTKKQADLIDQVTITADKDINRALLQVKDINNNKVLATKRLDIKKGVSTVSMPFRISNPHLWWTNGLGSQYMYHIQTEVFIGSKKVDNKSVKVGLRSLKLITKKDKDGTSFYFELNGVPVFCKGADYVPQDNFLPRVTDANYLRTIQDVAKSNMNMLRVWGGGIYENDVFYNLCDEYGILVWHDFMFACALYPASGAFLENVKQEAIDNVCRLRNHPCMAVWCGSNENQEGWYKWGWQEYEGAYKDRVWKEFKDLYYNTLPEVVKKYAPETPYWPSSPFADYGGGSEQNMGDYHYWGVWHGKEPIASYNTFRSRFFSEYGFQSFPEYISVKQYAPNPSDWNIQSEVMMSHQRGGDFANKLIETYLLNEYKKPDNFQRFLYMSQVLQGDAIKTAIEAHRRDMPYCMGSLFWQIDDCWPVASWASRDYYGRWKAQQYYARKAFQNVLVSPLLKKEKLCIYVVSDSLKAFRGKLVMKIMKFDGTIINQKESDVVVPSNSSNILMERDIDTLLKGTHKSDVFVYVSLTDSEGQTYDNEYVMLKQKEMNYPHVDIAKTIVSTDGGFKITLYTPLFARAVFLQVDDIKSIFSDNYFNLLPGEKRTIILKTSLSKVDLLKSLTIQSLVE